MPLFLLNNFIDWTKTNAYLAAVGAVQIQIIHPPATVCKSCMFVADLTNTAE